MVPFRDGFEITNLLRMNETSQIRYEGVVWKKRPWLKLKNENDLKWFEQSWRTIVFTKRTNFPKDFEKMDSFNTFFYQTSEKNDFFNWKKDSIEWAILPNKRYYWTIVHWENKWNR